MLRIGLTGGIGSGKSSAARCFQKLGVPVLDADAIARELTGPGQSAVKTISAQLGEDVSDDVGAMDRSRVRDIVFADPDKRRILEQVLHPLIQSAMRAEIASMTSSYCVLEIPLLIEGGEHPLVDRIAVVHAPQSVRIQRVMQRSGLSDEQIRNIIASQATDSERLARADDIIDNSGSLEQLDDRVRELHEAYLADLN